MLLGSTGKSGGNKKNTVVTAAKASPTRLHMGPPDWAEVELPGRRAGEIEHVSPANKNDEDGRGVGNIEPDDGGGEDGIES